MVITPKGRKKLASLMVIHEASQRDLAEAVGWSSHSYVGRILRGEVTSITPDAAARIAVYFGTPMDDLFVPRASGDTAQSAHRRRTVRSAA